MTIKIGEKIKQLRKKADVTQEKVAEYLGITFQSVSRWENGIAYPDIEILPAIANYFNVTTDELLGVDIANRQERVVEIRRQVQDNFNKGCIAENISILRVALNEFPNDYSLLSDFAFYLQVDYENKEYITESMSIYERIMADCTDDAIRYSSIQFLAYLYKHNGDKKKTLEIANRLPYMNREELLCQLLDGDDRTMHLQNHLMTSCENFARNIRSLSNRKDHNQHMAIIDKAMDVYRLTYENGDYGFYNTRMAWLCREKACVYIHLNDFDNALDYLDKAADYEIAYDTMPEVYLHTSLLFDGYEYFKGKSVVNNNISNACYKMLHNEFIKAVYDLIRDKERFMVIISKLKQYAREEE